MKRKNSPGSRANQPALRREKSASGAIARLLPELLEIQHQATEQAAGMIEIEVSLAPGPRARSSLELVLNTLIECRSLLAAAVFWPRRVLVKVTRPVPDDWYRPPPFWLA